MLFQIKLYLCTMNIVSHRGMLVTGLISLEFRTYLLTVNFNGQMMTVETPTPVPLGFGIFFPVSQLNENYAYLCPVVTGGGMAPVTLPPFKVIVRLRTT